ncbi:hypothetical protein [Paenibacillus sp. IITD108]|uniref:hypothetical protein n=1 Tax=Paenibacillus sp. IITD108 TaxID=3116649 RepID=UPI002F3F39C4
MSIKRKPGRPYAKNSRSITVPHRMTREENRMLRLKAALYTNSNTSELIRQAVMSFSREVSMPCMEVGCSGNMKLVPTSDQVLVHVGSNQHEIKIDEMPIYECERCGNQEIDLKFAAEVETIVDEEVGFLLNQRKEVPLVINFNDLMTV